METIKKLYYTMDTQQFNTMIEEMKKNEQAVHFFKNMDISYFYLPTSSSSKLLLTLHKMQLELDRIFTSCLSYQQEMILQSCMLDEMQSTNSTENIYSTRTDVFEIMKDVKMIRNKKIASTIRSYTLLKDNVWNIQNIEDIRKIYDGLMAGSYETTRDKPDGEYFRKDKVFITNGMKTVHTGFYPEDKIIEGMNDFIACYNNKNLDIYERILLSHFLMETIHPYYDGNGRLGRILMSSCLLEEEHTIFAYVIATSINKHKNMYYKALETARDTHEYACLNSYVYRMLEILIDGMQSLKEELIQKQEELTKRLNKSLYITLTKSEYKIYELLVCASVYTYFGISNDEIITYANVSKRTVVSTIKKFREHDMLEEVQMGKVTYHKWKDRGY